MDANIEISRSNSYIFTDTLVHDMVYYTSTSNQHMLFGTESNALSVINMSSCNVKVNRKLFVGAVQPYAPLYAQLEISDGGSNNQVVIYESSNNQQGMYLNSSNAEAKIGAYDWTNNEPIHLLIQQTGSNLGIGAGVSNPISLIHIKDNTTSNNILLEAGRTSDGTQEGFSAINFNGYSSNGDQRISVDKQRWRFKVDQTDTNEYAGVDSFDGTSEYYYITFSNKNVGINRQTPVARLHIQAETLDGTGDMTNSSNHPLTLQDTSGGPLRVVHLSASSSSSTAYNYETSKSIYWGESSDLGMYAFRGRFVAIQSNLSIGHSNPTTLLHMDSNSSNIVKFTNTTNTQGIYVGVENNNVVAGGGGLLWNASNAHIKFGTNNTERARFLSTGKLIIGSVSPSNADNQKALLELSDAGSNNQFMIYDNSNNRLGLSICSSNSVSRITSYNWSTSEAIHMTLQNRGSNVGIGKDITNPLGLLHMRNETSNNNVIIEAGRTSDGLNDGFSAINFNGYSSNNHKRINGFKNGWRIKVDQTGANEAFSIEELKASTSNTYITFSNVNVGISNLNPSARLHVRGQTLDGALTDKTDTSNNPLTLEDNSGSAMRIVYKNTNAAVSTIYNYEQAKNVYWGESNDNGIYVFRGRRTCFLSNLGINTINPQERMVLNAGNLYISTSGSIVTDNQLDINTSNQNIIINAVNAVGNISLRTGNIERAKITSTGILCVLSNVSIGTSNPPLNTILYAVSNSPNKIALTVENTNAGSAALTELNLLNNAGSTTGLVMFLNSTTNLSGNGGASNATLRNNCGDLRLASVNNNSLINMRSNGDITMSNNVFLTGNLRVAGPYVANPANVPLYINSNNASGYTVRFDNPSTANTSFTGLQLLSDTGQCTIFVNSGARSADGPVRCTTFKSDFGAMRLSSSNNNAFLFQDPTTSNTGINTLTPNYTLDVKGNVNASNNIYTNNTLRLDSSGNLTNVAMSGNSITSGTVAVNYGGTGANTLTTSKVLVGQGTSAVLAAGSLHWNESLTRLGIGTTTPATTLDVNGSIATSGTVRLTSTGALQNISTLSATTVSATTYSGLPTSSTSASGIVQLDNTVSSTSTSLAATASAVKTAYDTAASAASSASTAYSVAVGSVQKTGDTMSGNLNINATLFSTALTTCAYIPNTSGRPSIISAVIPGEIHSYGSGGSTTLATGGDDGFLRLSAGGGSAASTKSYIDISGYSTVADMDNNIVFGTRGAERMRIYNSGYIQMNAGARLYGDLHVNDSIRFRDYDTGFFYYSDGVVSWWSDGQGTWGAGGGRPRVGNARAGNWQSYAILRESYNEVILDLSPSDKRLKENIFDIDKDDFTRLLRSLRPVCYRMKESYQDFKYVKDSDRERGFIAQEIEKYMPELICKQHLPEVKEFRNYAEKNITITNLIANTVILDEQSKIQEEQDSIKALTIYQNINCAKMFKTFKVWVIDGVVEKTISIGNCLEPSHLYGYFVLSQQSTFIKAYEPCEFKPITKNKQVPYQLKIKKTYNQDEIQVQSRIKKEKKIFYDEGLAKYIEKEIETTIENQKTIDDDVDVYDQSGNFLRKDKYARKMQYEYDNYVNVLDDCGKIQWVDDKDENGLPVLELIKDVRFLDEQGFIISEIEYLALKNQNTICYKAQMIECVCQK